MSATTEIDLQIFIGRSSSISTSPYAGLPSFVFLHGRRPASREAAGHRVEDKAVPEGQAERVSYIVIANSEVVETVAFPFSEEEILTTIRRLEADHLRMQDCVSFGIRLFDFLFHRAVRDLYREVSAKAMRGRSRRKLRITIATSAPELAVLPWETMCDTYPRLLPSFLCHQPHIRLVRALRLFNRASFEEGKALGDEKSLRILTVTASPPGTVPIDVGMDEKILKFITEKAPRLERVELEVCKDATIVSLREHLHAFRPHIVHLACHAGYDPEEDLGFVALNSTREDQSAENINAFRLATLMQGTEIQLVFANTCLGARQQASSSFSGVAQCLHAMGIPNVVALQFQLTDRTAHAIVLNFYQYLLRDGLPVEDAVGQLRRQMFIDGYMAPETFGLTLFQTNTTLAWPVEQPAAQVVRAHAEAERFTSIFEQFELSWKEHIEREIQQEACVPGWQVEDLTIDIEGLPASYLMSAHEALGFWSVAVSLPRRLPSLLAIPAEYEAQNELILSLSGLIVSAAKLALQMAATRFESQSFQTALVVTTEERLQAYKSHYQLDASTTTETLNLLGASIKEALKLALKVDGEHRALMLVVNIQTRKIRTVVQSLAHVENDDAAFPKATRRWAAVRHYVQQAGVAFLLPGGGRVKLLLEGEQVLEFSGGKWLPANLRELRRSVTDLAKETGLEERILIDVFEKCLFAAEEPRSIGKAIIIQRRKSVFPKGVAKGFNPEQDLLHEFRDKPITEFLAEDYLKGGAGDNAMVISSEGHTLGVNVPLAGARAVKTVAGTGARHRSAQEVTKATDALAVVVSEDRPITVFIGGKVKFTYPPATEPASDLHRAAG